MSLRPASSMKHLTGTPRRGCGLRRMALGLALAALAGCAAPPSAPRDEAATVANDETGFVITQDVNVVPEVRADFHRAIGLLEEERYEEGIDLLLHVTKRAPHATAAHIDLGIAYRKAGKPELAAAALAQALALNPRHPVAHNEMGMLSRQAGRFEDARLHYEQALAVYPAFHFARRNLAILCDIYLADMECALENYELYATAVPEDAEAAMWIADLRNRTGQ
jgi:tetratricopeptide (TPR) repeat protein